MNNHRMMASSDCDCIGGILEKLLDLDAVKASPMLLERLHTARQALQDLEKSLDQHFADYDALWKQIFDRTTDPRVRIHGEYPPGILGEYERTIWQRYRILATAGAAPDLMCRVAKLEGFDDIERLQMLRGYFGLSLAEARAILSRVDGEP